MQTYKLLAMLLDYPGGEIVGDLRATRASSPFQVRTGAPAADRAALVRDSSSRSLAAWNAPPPASATRARSRAS